MQTHGKPHKMVRRSASSSGSEHGLCNLLCLLSTVKLLNNLQCKLQAGARALACDNVAIHDSLRVRPIRHHVLELLDGVASRILRQKPMRREDHRRAGTDCRSHLLLLRLRLQKGDECGAVTQMLSPWHAAGASNSVPLLVLALFDRAVGQDLQPARHLNLQRVHDARHSHLSARAYERVGDACRLDLLAVISNGHENLELFSHGVL
mmetsp:Transcript_13142/g.37529  ORF Transcript_13142/g.37529 Transcript_13142/m.37529 type:complete len:207 (+) Transcript_13142:81-701(+)